MVIQKRGVSATVTFNARPVTIHVTDANRLRWVLYALGTNELLATLVDRAGTMSEEGTLILDSSALILYKELPPVPVFVVMWDGYISYLEMQSRHCTVKLDSLDRCTTLIVGQLRDTLRALPDRTEALFSDSPSSRRIASPITPWKVSLHRSTTTWLRPIKNTLADPFRSVKLLGRRRMVFCGSVRPTQILIGSLLTHSRNRAKAAIEEAIMAAPHISELEKITSYGERAFEATRMLDVSISSEASIAYTVMSLLHRQITLSAISSMNLNLFISEFGYSKHIDPYDAHAYQRHLYIDFGSTRGPEYMYPRTADLAATHKEYKELRFISTDTQIGDYLNCTNYTAFKETSERQAAETVRQFLSPQ